MSGEDKGPSWEQLRDAMYTEYEFFTDTESGLQYICDRNGDIFEFSDNIDTKLYSMCDRQFNSPGKNIISLKNIADDTCTGITKRTNLRTSYDVIDYKPVIHYRIDRNNIIRITPDEIINIPTDASGIYFRDSMMNAPNSIPEETDKNLCDLLLEVNPLLGDYVLPYASALVSTFMKNIASPLVNVYGDHGTFKSGTCSSYQYYSDPTSESFDLSGDSFFGDHRARVMKFISRSVVFFDNMSNITPSQSDMMARIVTGTKESIRVLYKTTGTVFVPIDTALVINGITNNLYRQDVIDRTINIEMKAISKYVGFMEVKENIETTRPKILYAALNLVQKFLQYDAAPINPVNLRLMDYSNLTYLVGKECGYKEDEITKMFKLNKMINLKTVTEGSSIATWVLQNVDDGHPWKGRMTDFMNLMKREGLTQISTSGAMGKAVKLVYRTIYDNGHMVTKINTNTNVFVIRTRHEGEIYEDMGVIKE